MKRINFQVERQLFDRFNSIPWGMRASAMRKATELVCDLYEREGNRGIGALLDSDPRSAQILNISLEEPKK